MNRLAANLPPPALSLANRGALSRGRAARVALGWGLAALLMGGALALGVWLVPWPVMWAATVALVFGLKGITLLGLSEAERRGLTAGRGAAYFFLWLGMRPQIFLPAARGPQGGVAALWRGGLLNLTTGAALLALAAVLLPEGTPWWLRAWVGMAGVSFLIHFGAADLLAAFWRRNGVPAEKLFACPARATSLADFWGNRWNRVFSTFARDHLFRPLARRRGAVAATLAVFAFSGLVHELVISVPAGAGYGGPMLYFLIQGCLLLLESTGPVRRVLRRLPVVGWAWTAAVVLLPVPLLFHGAFLERVVLPFLSVLGGG